MALEIVQPARARDGGENLASRLISLVGVFTSVATYGNDIFSDNNHRTEFHIEQN